MGGYFRIINELDFWTDMFLNTRKFSNPNYEEEVEDWNNLKALLNDTRIYLKIAVLKYNVNFDFGSEANSIEQEHNLLRERISEEQNGCLKLNYRFLVVNAICNSDIVAPLAQTLRALSDESS